MTGSASKSCAATVLDELLVRQTIVTVDRVSVGS